MSEGLAKVSDVKVSGLSGFPRPYQVLAIDFAASGHNFAETMEYVFELTRKNHKTEKTAFDNAWSYTYRIFRGQSDTSAHTAYAFSKDQVYLSGFLKVIRETERGCRARTFDSIMTLLRFSTLTLDELNKIDAVQAEIEAPVGRDPFRNWGYNAEGFYRGYAVPDPVELVAKKLLGKNFKIASGSPSV